MANLVEGEVIQPYVWLSLADITHKFGDQTPFLERAAPSTGKILSDFNKNHSDRMIRIADRVARAVALASLMGLAFGLIHSLGEQSYEGDEISISYGPATLPLKITDEFTIDNDWIKRNCNKEGKLLSGIEFPSDYQAWAEAACNMFSNPTKYPEYLIP